MLYAVKMTCLATYIYSCTNKDRMIKIEEYHSCKVYNHLMYL